MRRGLPLVFGLSLTTLAAALALIGSLIAAGHDGPNQWALILLATVVFGAVGATVVVRGDGNAVGWWMLGMGVVLGPFQLLVDAYADYSYRVHPLPAASFVAWSDVLPSGSLVGLLSMILLLYPTGHLPSRRWRWLVVAIGVDVATSVLVAALRPGQLDGPPYANPLGVHVPGLTVLGGVADVAQIGGLLVSAGSVVLRWRLANGVQRQQLKCLAAAALLWPVVVIPLLTLPTRVSDSWVGGVLFILPIVATAVAVGVAITRYRLYDVDRVVSRTVSYAVVTGLLVGVYVGVVALTTRVLPFGGSVGTAASVLVAVALFAPLRRRVQHLVDRRFNRTRYDAEATVESFAHRLRDDVELDTVRRDLLAAVHATVQPAAASVWLRESS
ncbi:MAG TPA: hypothetical protein VFJ19_03635 [Nocardioidaceae bacterium]|nr:hypothetical protein [Nocardioidaceae bacterium]